MMRVVPVKAASDEDMTDLAASYAAQRSRPRPAGVDQSKTADGKRIAEYYYHCSSCHRPQFTGGRS